MPLPGLTWLSRSSVAGPGGYPESAAYARRGRPAHTAPTRQGPPALFSDQAFRLGGKAKPTGGCIAHLWRSAVGSMALDPLHPHAWPFLHPGPSSALLCLFPDPSPGHLLPFLQGILFSRCPAPSSSLHLLFQNTYIYSVFQTIQPLFLKIIL